MTADQIEGGGFAGAVGPDHGMTLTLGNAQVEIVDDPDITEALFDAANFNGRGHARCPRSRAPVVARSQASAIRRHVIRATTNPPTIITTALIQVPALVASKGMPTRVMT